MATRKRVSHDRRLCGDRTNVNGIEGELKVLSQDEIHEIHQCALEILDSVGVRLLETEALRVFAESGAYVDFDKKIARIPEHLINEAMKKVPRSFALYGRSHQCRLEFGDDNGRVYFSMSGALPKLLDLENGRCRGATLRDVDDLYRLGDALENVDRAGTAWPTDVPSSVGHAYVMLSGFVNTTKPQPGWNEGEAQSCDSVRMASVVAGSEDLLKKEPRLLGYLQPVSPLQYTVGSTRGARIYAKHNQPLVVAPWPQGGATAPVTLAGALVQQTAEMLSGVVMVELFNPSAPVICGLRATIMDQRTGCLSIGGIERGLMSIASGQLARYYGLPSVATGGSDSKIADAQASFEKATTVLMAALSGASLVDHAIGSLESAGTHSYDQAVIDNEICGMIRRALHGFAVDNETLAVDVIKSVGLGGSFLGQRHTLERYEKEVYQPRIVDRRSRAAWEKAGSRDLREVARQEAKRILEQHHPEPLDRDIKEELEKIVKDIENRELRCAYSK